MVKLPTKELWSVSEAVTARDIQESQVGRTEGKWRKKFREIC